MSVTVAICNVGPYVVIRPVVKINVLTKYNPTGHTTLLRCWINGDDVDLRRNNVVYPEECHNSPPSTPYVKYMV